MHGTHMMSPGEIREVYGRELVNLKNEGRWSFLNTLFSVSEAVMYMQVMPACSHVSECLVQTGLAFSCSCRQLFSLQYCTDYAVQALQPVVDVTSSEHNVAQAGTPQKCFGKKTSLQMQTLAGFVEQGTLANLTATAQNA